MALIGNRTTNGFELVGNLMEVGEDPVMMELTPNTAFSAGDMVVLTYGKIAAAAAGATNVVGVITQTFTTTTNPSAAQTFGPIARNPYNIYRCTIANHKDSTATGGTTTTLVDSVLSGGSADNDWRGALVYIYAGTNSGILATVKSYTAATGTLAFEKAFPAACDTTTKYIMLGKGGVNDVINQNTVGVNLVNAHTIDAGATIASEAGPISVLNATVDLVKNLVLDVMITKHAFQH